MKPIEDLFNQIEAEDPFSEHIRELVLKLVDEYKDDRITPFIIKLMKKGSVKELNSILLYSCHEYSVTECIPYFNYFIDIIINSNFEAAWAAASLISDMRQYFSLIEISQIQDAHSNLLLSRSNLSPNADLMKDVIFYLEEDVLRN